MHDCQNLLHVGEFYFLKEKVRFTNELFGHGDSIFNFYNNLSPKSTYQQAALTPRSTCFILDQFGAGK